jgi:hypothetical protein
MEDEDKGKKIRELVRCAEVGGGYLGFGYGAAFAMFAMHVYGMLGIQLTSWFYPSVAGVFVLFASIAHFRMKPIREELPKLVG